MATATKTKKDAQTLAAESEERRLETRKAIRRKLAELALIEKKVSDKKALAGKYTAAIDEAEREHRAVCLPLQDELNNIEKAILQRLADRTADDPGNESRRMEIVADIDAANEKLTREIELQKKLREPILLEVEQLRIAMAPKQSLENDLARHSKPEQRDELWMTRNLIQYLRPREIAAKQKVESYKASLEAAEYHNRQADAEIYAERLRLWKLEHARATSELAKAVLESDRIHAAMVNE